MMKKVMFALCFMFGGIVAVTAQDTQTQDTTSNQYRTETQSQFPQDAQGQNQSQDMMGQQDRERIQVTELPDEVKRSLEGQEYRGWLISGAFKAQGGQSYDSTSSDASQQPSNAATGAEDEEVYIVELKNGAETKTIGFDSKGEVVEGIGGDQNSQLNGQNNDMNQPETSPNNDQTDQSQSSQDQSQSSQSATPAPGQSTSTPSGQSTQSDQATTDTQTQSDQSTETQTDTQTDQSRANGPK